MNIHKSLYFLALLVHLCACNPSKKDLELDTINLTLKLDRFDQELFDQTEETINNNSLRHFSKYGFFYERYLQEVLNVKDVYDPMLVPNVKMFINNEDMREVYNHIQLKFKDVTSFEEEFTAAFKRYNFYFPDSLIPKIATFMSGFNFPTAASDSVLGIGLDMYLGSDSEFYALIGLPQYKTRLMQADYLVADAVKSWIVSEWEYDASEEDMLGQLIYQGKLLYVIDQLLPNTPDTIKTGFSLPQLVWCKNNEAQIWAFIIDNNLLFSNNNKEINKLIKEGPFTPGLPRESPGRVGIWIGWQIIKAYMDKEMVDLSALLNTHPNEILKGSKYKPKL